MINNEDHIKKLFGDKLSRFEAEVPDALWSRIDNSLSQTAGIPVRHRSVKRTRIIQLGTVAAMVAALIALIVLLDIGESPSQQLVAPVAESVYHEKAGEVSQTNKPIEETNLSVRKPQELVALVTKPQRNVSRDVLLHNVHASETIVASEVNGAEIQKTVSEVTESVAETRTPENKRTKEEIAAAVAQFTQSTDPKGQNKTESSSKSGYTLAFGGRSNVALVNEVAKTSAQGSPYLPPKLYSKKDEGPEMRHNQPISFGLTVSKQLNSHLSIETGVTYTYLSARVKSNPDADFKVNDSQNFHYFGVPLTLNYRFANWGKARFYVSAGGAVQKDFYGFHKGQRSIADLLNTETYQKNKISQKNPQFSINSTLGVSYPIYKDLRVYTTVGVAHYFDADNEYKTIFSDRKTQLDLNAGFRYEF